jgi:hypothetical protein
VGDGTRTRDRLDHRYGARVRTGASIATALVVTTLIAGCGGGKATPSPSATPEGAARAAAVAGVMAFGSNDQCVQGLTSGLIHRVYGSVARCRRVVSHSNASPNFDANVVADKVTGQRALVRVLVKNGDDPDIAGNVTLRYERAAWRIDDLDAQYLRTGLGKAVSGEAGVVDPVLDADIGACIDRRFQRVGDAGLKRVAYGVLGERHAALVAVYRAMARCDTRGVSVLRRLFERDVLDEIQAAAATTPDNVKCVLRGLRIIASDALIGEVLASGSIDGKVAQKLLYPKLLRAAVGCDAPKPLPLSPA